MAKAVAHYAYENEDFTKYMCKILLKGINRSDYDKVKNYLEVVSELALLNDSL